MAWFGGGSMVAARRWLMETDVVCGMEVDPEEVTEMTEYKDRTYYFCSKECKDQFEADPKKYAQAA
jgi:YHS domain-containing protein